MDYQYWKIGVESRNEDNSIYLGFMRTKLAVVSINEDKNVSSSMKIGVGSEDKDFYWAGIVPLAMWEGDNSSNSTPVPDNS